MNINMILDRVPEYTEFFTVEEMNQRSFELARQYQSCVAITEVGRSKRQQPIYCLKIGKGSKKALLYGTPHPNEPIGTMMLDAFSRILAEDEELRNRLDYTWYIVKSSDVDGMKLNEGWFKGPFTITNYQHHFFRPAFDQQVEWSFPIDYKDFHYDKPTVETQCIMRLIDQVKPDFIYSLHNSGFGGCYWYLSDGTQELFQKLHDVPAKYQIALNLGEPEMPYCENLCEAIYKMTGAKDNYDYLEKFMPDKPAAQLMNGGGCSFEYANRDGELHSRILVTEMPYYSDPRVSDIGLSDRTRREVVLEGCELALEDYHFWKPVYDRICRLMSMDNPFYLAAKERCGLDISLEAKKKWAMQEASMEETATVCQVFDNLLSSRFYSNLSIVLLRRACDFELENSVLEPAQIKILQDARNGLYEKECANLDFLERELDYTAIPIAQLVKVQMECGLLYAQYVHDL